MDMGTGVGVRVVVELAAELEMRLVVSVEDVLIKAVDEEGSEDDNGLEKAELKLEDTVGGKAVLDGFVETSEPRELEAATDGTGGALELLDVGKLDKPVGEVEEEGMDDGVRMDDDNGELIDSVDERRPEDDLDELSLQRPNPG
ncbi:hypothetical protein HBI24_151560 [Parastagonospora nodorum]|nr:hypothetical protein HBI47_098120 [Parastagonospora nodorum]KAH5579719.1 hypothetical protein HBI24_151560 [Parastagonospora nodorum]